MEQVQNGMMSMLQAMTAQTELPRSAKSDSTDTGDFQKLLDQKTQSARADSPARDAESAEKPDTSPKSAEGPEEPQPEDAQTMAKRLLQSGLVPADASGLSIVPLDVEEPRTELADGPAEGEIITPALLTGETPQVRPGLETAPDGQTEQPFQEQTDSQPQLTQAGQTRSARTEAPTEEVPAARTVQAAEEQPREEEPEMEITHTAQGPRQVFEDVKAAPIKVGEAPAPEQTEGKDVAEQVSSQLLQALEKGESLVKIDLTPGSLGSVTVEITRSSEGVLHVALSAQSSETRNLLERHASDLQGLLNSRGQEPVQVEVQRQQETQQHQDNPYDGHNGHSQDGQQQHQRRRQEHSQDFVQQLRLGLIPTEE